MSRRHGVPGWLLVAAGVTAAVFAFARKQNRGERVGGPISLPKTLWLNYTLISWFVLPGALLRRDDLSPGARAALQAHLMSFVARGSAEMWLLYRTHAWRVAYGVGHDALDLALITVALRRGGRGGAADGVARRHLDAIRATLLFEMAFASLFHLAIGGKTKGEDGIYFASNEPQFRRINALTAAVDVAAYARMMLVMRDLVRLR
ncbi:MAG TPA: hypothetical protein VEY93_09180 [Longimicrobium sp.]|nr:hypothetical protein [Longimicrobium sp.]